MKKRRDSQKIFFIWILAFTLILVADIAGSISPVISTENPYGGRRSVSIYKENLSVLITDLDSTFDWTIETGPDIGSSSANNENNGTKVCTISGLQHETTYTWYVNVTDGVAWTRDTFTFTTKKSWQFDINEYKLNVFGWHVGAFERYFGAFVMPILFMIGIAFFHVHARNLPTTVFMILLTFALYGTTNTFIQAEEYSLFFAIIAIIGIAGTVLALFVKRRN